LKQKNYWNFGACFPKDDDILSSNLSRLCPRFLRTPTRQKQNKPGAANNYIHVPTITRTQIYLWVISPGPMGNTALCILIFSSSCCLYCQKSATCLVIARLLLEKVGHICLLDSWSLSDEMYSTIGDPLVLGGLQFGSLPAASFQETCRNQMFLRHLLLFQMEAKSLKLSIMRK